MSRNRRKAASRATRDQAEMDRNDAIQAKMDRREIEDSSDSSDGNIASKGLVNVSKGPVTCGPCSDEQVKKRWNEVPTPPPPPPALPCITPDCPYGPDLECFLMVKKTEGWMPPGGWTPRTQSCTRASSPGSLRQMHVTARRFMLVQIE